MTLDQIEKICDKEGFWVNKYDDMYGEGKPGWEIGQMSSCGEDWFETFEADDVDTFIANLESRIDNWDSEEEAMPYIERRGQNGVPSSIRDLLDDADWKVEQLKDLLDAIKEAPDEENEIEESKKQEWKETSSDEFGDIETNKYYEIEVDDGFLDDRFDSEKAAVEFARKQKGDVRIYVNGSEKYTSGEYKGQSEPLEGILVWERVNGKERSASNFDPKRESKKQEGYIIRIDKDGVDGYWGPQSDAINNNNNVDKLSARIFKSRGAAQREINRYKHEMGNAQIEEINESKKVTEAPEDEIDVDKLADEVEPTRLDEIITEWEAKSPLHERIIEEIIDDSEGYDGDKLAQIKGRLGDISYGLVNGTVGSLIYYDDTNKFFEEYYDDIWDVVQEWSEQGVEPLEALKRNCDEVEIIMGTDNFKCWVVWMVYEEIAYLFGEALDEINSEEKVSA